METQRLLAHFYLPGTLRRMVRILMSVSLGPKCPACGAWTAGSGSPERYPVGITQVWPGVLPTTLVISSRKNVSGGSLGVQAEAWTPLRTTVRGGTSRGA